MVYSGAAALWGSGGRTWRTPTSGNTFRCFMHSRNTLAPRTTTAYASSADNVFNTAAALLLANAPSASRETF